MRDRAPQADPVGIPPIRWYSRAALDEFLSAAEREQTRLEATIAEAQVRLARANSAVGLHQTMIEMILEAQREVAEIRSAAEVRSGEIIAAGELEADVILRSRPMTVGNGSSAHGSPRVASAPLSAEPSSMGTDDEFFSYLRHELDKDEPLGPWQP